MIWGGKGSQQEDMKGMKDMKNSKRKLLAAFM
jgi:hypothetical protein